MCWSIFPSERGGGGIDPQGLFTTQRGEQLAGTCWNFKRGQGIQWSKGSISLFSANPFLDFSNSGYYYSLNSRQSNGHKNGDKRLNSLVLKLSDREMDLWAITKLYHIFGVDYLKLLFGKPPPAIIIQNHCFRPPL